MKISFVTFGCKVNTSESEQFSSEIAEKGYIISSADDADIIVINGCAVTEHAALKCLSYISSLRKKKPSLKIIAAGCIASSLGKTALEKAGADIIVTNASKSSLINHIITMTDGLKENDEFPFFGQIPLKPVSRTRAFFKIQDGCNANCAYCIIPKLRGKPSSKPFNESVSEFRRLIDLGYKEIILTGIHIGLYGERENHNITELLARLSEEDGNYRIRLSSLEVTEINDELISLMEEKPDKICPHLHIPLQSGSDKILKSMGRRYLSENYIDAARRLKEKIKNLTIGSDVIVGFPNETEEDFNNTINTLKAAKADFIHVFPYSDRKGTPASLMDNKIKNEVKERRASYLRNIWKEITFSSLSSMMGKTLRVLTERGNKGHSDNYMQVLFNSDIKPNLFVNAYITGVNKGKLIGEILI